MADYKLTFWLLFLSLGFGSSLERPSQVIETKQGKIQGRTASINTNDGGAYEVDIFRGIPFAAAPMGSLRFMPPVTVSPWRNIKSASKFGKVCPQNLPDISNRTEALKVMSEGRIKEIEHVMNVGNNNRSVGLVR